LVTKGRQWERQLGSEKELEWDPAMERGSVYMTEPS